MGPASKTVLILGAGAAGLTAARDLRAAGFSVVLLEARDRLGGRLWTAGTREEPAELGAEFIHGSPPDLLSLLQEAGLHTVENSEGRLIFRDGSLHPLPDFWEMIELVNSQIDPEREISYEEFLAQAEASPMAKQIARAYVEGFNAARSDLISAPSIAVADAAASRIGGDHLFRPKEGYGALVQWLAGDDAPVRLRTVAQAVQWKPASVEVHAATPEGPRTYLASRLLVTLPVGVLRAAPQAAGSLTFDPPLPAKTEALRHLHMGLAIRMTFLFRQPFWRVTESFGLLTSVGPDVPTWWTRDANHSRILTGWAGGLTAEPLLGLPEAELRTRALTSLARLFHLPESHLEELVEAFYFHDWSRDPFSLGAYSYPGVNGLAAARALAEPVAHTLFFAGEGTDSSGHYGTVHAAITSGHRAAREIIDSA